jgi:hypothetical protein
MVVVPVEEPFVDNTPVIDGETRTDAVKELVPDVEETKLEAHPDFVKL